MMFFSANNFIRRHLFISSAAALLACVLGLPGLSFAQIIDAIEVEGNSRVEEGTVLLQVSSDIGKEFNPAKVEKDIKNIYRTGFFDQVVAKKKVGPQGVVLVFAVTEKPAIREIKIEGNDEVSTSTIEEKLNIGARRFLDRRKITIGIDEVKKYYQGEGYYGTEVDLDVSPVQQNQVDLTFKITEGQEKVIREVAFEGSKGLDEDDLEDVVRTSRYKWWSSWLTGSGVVKEDQLEADVKALTHHYLTKGYVNARVTTPAVEETKKGLRVVFKIDEGDVYNFGKVSAQGTLLENSAKKTLENINIKPGETFNVDTLRKDTFAISEKFSDIGYAFVNVDPLTQINRDTKTVDIAFNVDKGSLIRINRINITGNQKTRDNVIRRSLKIEEQELFSSSKIKRSQELLERLGYFDEVTINPEQTGTIDEVDLGIAVREGTTGTFSIGAGFSSGDGFIVTSKVSENNIFGTGNSVSLDVDSGSRRENYVLSFRNPRVNDSYWSTEYELLSTRREFDDFDREQRGGGITAGYPLWFLGNEVFDDVRFSLSYELLSIDISNIDKDAPMLIKDAKGSSTSSSVTPRLVRNTIDNPLDPTKGSRQNVGVELAGLGGEEKFWLGEAQNTFYYPLWDSAIGPFVISQRTRFGYGESFNDEDFPLFRRFFPGGINSVRGFDARELGPKDAEGNEFGGNKQLIGNFELIFPIVTSIGLRGVVFYDIGNAFDDEESIEFGELRQAFGWGVRWRSPLAPIRIEIGYPIDREPGEKAVVTNFSLGSPL